MTPQLGLGQQLAGRFGKRSGLLGPPALEDTDVLEVSTTELDDVVRLEDKYGRAGT